MTRRCRQSGTDRASVALVAATSILLLGCDAKNAPRDNAAAENVAAPAPPQANIASAIPVPEPALDREKLLLAVVRAASASAAGTDDRQAQSELAGRQFTLRIPIGCPGAGGERTDDALGWTYDEATGALKVRARPDISEESPLIRAFAAPGVEAAEGFWIPRPWLLTPVCPRSHTAPAQIAPTPSVGLVQFFTSADTRARRRTGRSFETVQKMDPQSVAGIRLGLVISGRLKGDGGKVIRCAAPNADTRPVCIVAVEFNAVAIENETTGSALAEWSLG